MANPKISSIAERGIKVENVNEGVPINVFVKKGIPLSFTIDMDTNLLKKKIKVGYLNQNQKQVKDEVIPNKEIFYLLNQMKKYMFSTETVLYGFYDNGKMKFYDCVSNTNFFPYQDLVKVSTGKFNYSEYGFELLKPVLSGYLKSEEVVAFFEKYINENPKRKISDLFIMPAFPEFSSPTYSFYDEVGRSSKIEPKEDEMTVEEIIEEMKKDSADCFPELEEVETESGTNGLVLLPDFANKINKVSCRNIFVKDSKVLTKSSEYTYSYIEKFLKDEKIELNEIEKSLMEAISLMWTVWQSPENMNSVYNELLVRYFTMEGLARALAKNHRDSLSLAFYFIWFHKEQEIYKEFTSEQKLAFNVRSVSKILGGELDFYIEAFKTHYLALGVLIDKYENLV